MENLFQQDNAQRSWIGKVPGARVAFKYHLVSYLIMNVSFWLGWFSSEGSNEQLNARLPWPFYPMMFGAVALLFHFLAAYVLPGKNYETNGYKQIK